MLQKLAKLGTEIEGRYATDLELEELETYLSSIDNRVSTYEKIANQSQTILNSVIEKTLFTEDFPQTNKCQRDLTIVLRHCSAAMLINDLDRLREGFLLWLQTIVKAFKCTRYTQVEYRILQEVIKTILTEQEMEIMLPSLQLAHTLLAG